MNIDNMIEVMQAYRDGAEIEARHKNKVLWFPDEDKFWDFNAFDYRIKHKSGKDKLIEDVDKLWCFLDNNYSDRHLTLVNMTSDILRRSKRGEYHED